MKKLSSIFAIIILSLSQCLFAQTVPSAQSLIYTQDFSSLSSSSTTYTSGFQGWKIGSASGSTFKTAAPTIDQSLIASSSASNTTGGVHNYNGKTGILASGSVDPSLAMVMNTSGFTNVQVTFDIMTIRNPYDGSSNTRLNNVELQYRVGSSVGTFTSASGSIYRNNTTTQTGSGVTTPQNSKTITVTLPSACDNQSFVQLRWVQRDSIGSGFRPSFAFDNICVSGTGSITVSGPTTFCQGGSVQLTAISGDSWSWSTGATTQSITVTTAGTYSVTTTKSPGCSSTSSIVVTVNSFNDPLTVFAESMGTVSVTTSISTQESNDGFDNDNYTMTGTADVRNTSSSSGEYSGASGGANIFFTSTSSVNFQIENINTTGKNGLQLSFGVYKSTTTSNGSNFSVEVSSDGSTYSPLSFSALPTGTGTADWFYRTASGSIPATSNLRIRFTQTDMATSFRIDDVSLVEYVTGPRITGNNLVCSGGSTTLTTSGGTTYTWSTGATTATISVSPTVTTVYSVTATNSNGCISSSSQAVLVPIDLGGGSVIPQTFSMVDTTVWFKFVPTKSKVSITIGPSENPSDTPTAYINRVSAYSGSCGSFSTFATTGLITNHNISWHLDGLTVGNTYYIKLSSLQKSGFGALQLTSSIIFGSNAFGINYWMPHSIGTTTPNGDVDPSNTQITNEIRNASPNIIRIGGKAYDSDGGNTAYFSDYAAAVQHVKNDLGAEPLVQIPVKYGTFGFSATDAKNLVIYLNSTPYQLGVKYFSIGNEWNNYQSPQNKLPYMSQHFKDFAVAMKNAYSTAMNDIKIVGPSPGYFGAKDGNNTNILFEMIGNPGGLYDIAGPIDLTAYPTSAAGYYLDIVDWHTYPYNYSLRPATRSDIIGYPGDNTNGFANNITNSTFGINKYITSANTQRSGNDLKFSITEINVNDENPPYSGTADDNDATKNSVPGLGAAGFLDGQFWADMFSQMFANGGNNATFMIPWSAYEGNPLGDRDATELGIFDGLFPNEKPRSTYYHLQMIASFCLHGPSVFPYNVYEIATTTSNGSPDPNLKAFAIEQISRGDNSAVIILNQNTGSSSPQTYSVRFNGGTSSSAYYQINVLSSLGITSASGSPQTNWNFDSPSHHPDLLENEQTAVVVFSCNGQVLNTTKYSASDNLNNLPPSQNDYGFSVCHGARLAHAKQAEVKKEQSPFVRIVPNPGATQISIYYNLGQQNGSTNEQSKTSIQSEIAITNVFGAIINRYKLDNNIDKLDIDCTKLQNDIYLVSLIIDGKVSGTSKMVITK